MLTSGHHRTMMIMNIKPISSELQIQVENLKNKMTPDSYKYIGVDEGWYLIVADCDRDLTAINPDYQILQIKEKFGGLRFYIKPINATPKEIKGMNKVIRRYEGVASKTCEATGLSGVLMKSVGGWLKTLNPEYASASLHYARYEVVNKPPSDEEWSDAIR